MADYADTRHARPAETPPEEWRRRYLEASQSAGVQWTWLAFFLVAGVLVLAFGGRQK